MAINLSDTKAQVRLKQGLQSAENDEEFTKFEVYWCPIPAVFGGGRLIGPIAKM